MDLRHRIRLAPEVRISGPRTVVVRVRVEVDMILVVGAGGSLGRKIVRGLLERGEIVRALVRSDKRRAAIEREGGVAVSSDS